MKKLNPNSETDQMVQSLYQVTSKSKLSRLKNMLALLHKTNRMTINLMAKSLKITRRTAYRYCKEDLKDEVVCINGWIYLSVRQFDLAA